MNQPEITTPCIYCASQAVNSRGTMWAARGLDWPTITWSPGVLVHKACERHVSHAVESFGRTRREGDALVWDTNGSEPFDDMLAMWVALGLITDAQREATSVRREQRTREFLANYRANPPQRSAEEIAEMRAAFGPGETVVDVITGERIQL